jgi:hypothetical protein
MRASHISDSSDAEAARANCPILAACCIFYYKVEIINRGQEGHVFIFPIKSPSNSYICVSVPNVIN